MPLNTEQMRLYMIEYRKTHPEYVEKHKNKVVANTINRYNTDEEYKKKRQEYMRNHYHEKKNALIAIC